MVIVETKKQKIEKKEIVKTQQVIKGRVVSAKTPKTAVVLVERRVTHPLYGKTFRRSKRYLVHDEKGVSEGDLVEIIKCSPISKNKHFMIYKVVGKNMEAIIAEQLKEEAAETIAEVMPVEKETEESSVIGEPVTEKQKTGKQKSENRKLKTDNKESK